MSDTLAQLKAFFAKWREPLERRALVRFEAGPAPQDALTLAAKADAFSGQFGFNPLCFNWEMLDPSVDLTAPRSARGTLVEALTKDIGDRKTSWLSARDAMQFAVDLTGLFDPGTLSVLTNQLNGLWHPISGASDEWSFAVMDDEVIALLVLVLRA